MGKFCHFYSYLPTSDFSFPGDNLSKYTERTKYNIFIDCDCFSGKSSPRLLLLLTVGTNVVHITFLVMEKM